MAAAVLELLLDRVLPALESQPLSTRWVMLALFSRNLAAVLGVLVFGLALLGAIGRKDLLPRPARALLGVVGVVLVPLLGWAALAPIPHFVLVEVQVSFVFFALTCAIAGFASRAEMRTKLLLALLAVPPLLRGYATASASVEALALGRLDARDFAETTGEVLFLLAGITAPLLAVPRGHLKQLFTRGVLAATLAVAIAAGLFAFTRFGAAQAIAGALGLRLTEEPAGAILYLAALLGLLWVLFALYRAQGGARLIATGLALVAVAGYGLERPSELTAIALGLLLVVQGAALPATHQRSPLPVLDLGAWRRGAQALAQQFAGDFVLVEDDGRQVTRIAGRDAERPIVVRVVRERGMDAVEVVVGAPPPEGDPAFEVEERHGAPESATFERRYRLRESGNQHALALDEARRAALEPLGGTTAVWPGQGAKWRRSFESPAPLETLHRVAQVLGSLLG